MHRPAERAGAFYNRRGPAEQHIEDGKSAINWTRLSCHSFRHNEVQLQLYALAHNLGDFMHFLALGEDVKR